VNGRTENTHVNKSVIFWLIKKPVRERERQTGSRELAVAEARSDGKLDDGRAG
jgi:hypothetical protein